MPSAEVFRWGTFGVPTPSRTKEETAAEGVAPLENARRFHVCQVYAGFGAVALRGHKHVEWVPEHVRPLTADGGGDADDGSRNFSSIGSFTGVESVAFGQHHALLLQRLGVGDDYGGSEGDVGGGATAVLAYGSGQHGQASAERAARSGKVADEPAVHGCRFETLETLGVTIPFKYVYVSPAWSICVRV